MKSDVVDLDVHVHARTERAVLVSDDGRKDKAVRLPLPQHWIRDTQPHIYWCPFCERPVSKWHEHHGPRKSRQWKAGKD